MNTSLGVSSFCLAFTSSKVSCWGLGLSCMHSGLGCGLISATSVVGGPVALQETTAFPHLHKQYTILPPSLILMIFLGTVNDSIAKDCLLATPSSPFFMFSHFRIFMPFDLVDAT